MTHKIIIGLAILMLSQLFGGAVPSLLLISAASAQSGALDEQSILVDGQERTYYIFAPKSSGKPMPMVLAFHGGGGGALQFAERMNLVGMAKSHGMILVMPQGVGRGGGDGEGRGGSWNADSTTPMGYAERNGIDDLGFASALLREVPSKYPVDASRIYAIGFSKGGMMAYRAACVLGSKITAIAVVSATVSSADCPKPKGVSVLHIHGTDDENVPYEGGAGEFTGGRADWPAVERGLAFFTRGNQCATKGTKTQPASDTTCTTQQCGGQERVELCLVKGGGHAWPGSQPARWQVRRNVYVSQKFDATDYVARFLLSQ